MNLPDILSTLVILVAMPLTWTVAVLLWRLSNRDSTIKVLRAHAVAGLVIALIVTVFGLVFVNNGLSVPVLNTYQTQLVTRGTLLILSVSSAVYWLGVVWRAG